MKNLNGCDFEPQLVKAIKKGNANEQISAHLNACPDCQETARIVSFFQRELAREPLASNLPAAGFLWWKAKLREKKVAAERAARPIIIAQTIAVFAIFFSGIYLIGVFSSDIETILSRTFASMEPVMFPLLIGIIIFAFLAAILIFALNRLMPEK